MKIKDLKILLEKYDNSMDVYFVEGGSSLPVNEVISTKELINQQLEDGDIDSEEDFDFAEFPKNCIFIQN